MDDFLDTLAQEASRTIEAGYYQVEATQHRVFSLKESIVRCNRNPIIAEIKLASPSGNIVGRCVDIACIASAMKRGGAIGISIITEPKYFGGSLQNFKLVRETVSIPLLMKDFIISRVQVEAASKIGADAILLIQALFDRKYCDSSLNEMIEYAHFKGLEVLLEAHTKNEFKKAIRSDADLIGINNRDLKTLVVNIHTTEEILREHIHHDKIIVSESGIESPAHILFLKGAGAKAFLVGTAVMSAHDVEGKVKELVESGQFQDMFDNKRENGKEFEFAAKETTL